MCNLQTSDNPGGLSASRSAEHYGENSRAAQPSVGELQPGAPVTCNTSLGRGSCEGAPWSACRQGLPWQKPSFRIDLYLLSSCPLRFETVPVPDDDKKVVVEVMMLEKDFSSKEEVERNFLLMSIAYAANIGQAPCIYFCEKLEDQRALLDGSS